MAKTPKKKSDAPLESPAGTAVDTPRAVIEWPESTETRELDVSLSDEEAAEQGKILVQRLKEKAGLVSQKKASAKDYDAQIETVDEAIEKVSTVVSTQVERRGILCKWLYEVNGFDKDGKEIRHSEVKTLVRVDSGALVEVKPITSEERQMVLPLNDEERFAHDQEFLTLRNWEVVEAHPDAVHQWECRQRNSENAAETSIAIFADTYKEAIGEAAKCVREEEAGTIAMAVTNEDLAGACEVPQYTDADVPA